MIIDTGRIAKWVSIIGVIAMVVFFSVPPVDGSAEAQEREHNAIQDKLDAWCEEYDLPEGYVVFWGYDDLYGEYSAAGMCAPPNWMPQIYGYGNYHSVVLDDCFKDGRFTWDEECVLFHEFCHALNGYLNGNVPSHGDEFWDLMDDKPLYRIGCEVANWTALSAKLMVR